MSTGGPLEQVHGAVKGGGALQANRSSDVFDFYLFFIVLFLFIYFFVFDF